MPEDQESPPPHSLDDVLETPIFGNDAPISFNALTDTHKRRGRGLCLTCSIGNILINVFIDSGAEQNFLSPAIATQLGNPIDYKDVDTIEVANRRTCCTKVVVFNIEMELQSYKFTNNYRLLAVTGCDLMLGTEWLETLGYIGWHFRDKIMEFAVNGCNFRLIGEKPIYFSNRSSLCHLHQVLADYPTPKVHASEPLQLNL